MRWLLRWQHVAPQSQAAGERGLLEVVRQLQGFEIPANAWEKRILASRVNAYDPAVLDQLCLTGAVGWGRLSPHPATLEDSGESRRRVVPTSVAPITLFVREDADWMQPRSAESDERQEQLLTRIGTGRARIPATARGFLLCRHRARNRQAESRDRDRSVGARCGRAGHGRRLRESALADQSQSSQRSPVGTPKVAKPRNTAGRWSLLYTDAAGRPPQSCRGHLLDAAAALRSRLPRSTGARVEPAKVA